VLTIKTYPLSQSPYASQIYAGLFDLAQSGEIYLKFVWQPSVKIQERSDWGNPKNRRIAYFEVWDEKRLVSKICFDMLDGPEIISLDGLEKCDVYFKRSYSEQFWASNPDLWQQHHPDYVKKIHPYGFNVPCNSPYEFGRAKNKFIYNIATKQLIKKPLKSLFSIAGEFVKPRKKPIFDVIAPDVPAENFVLYQTRLFDPNEGVFTDERRDINATRIAIIKALKSAFGKQFIGGLMADEYSKKHCPDLITQQETAREKYLELVKNCNPVVFSKGLRQSTGWRFPEYMSMSRCIVSETLEYQPAFPLIDGKHYLTFTNPEECVASCRKLINDDDLAQTLRDNIYQYYHDHNTPKAIIRNAIDVAVNVSIRGAL